MQKRKIMNALVVMIGSVILIACVKKPVVRMPLLPLPKPKLQPHRITLKELLKKHPKLKKLHDKWRKAEAAYDESLSQWADTSKKERGKALNAVIDLEHVFPPLEKLEAKFATYKQHSPERRRAWLMMKSYRMLAKAWEIDFTKFSRSLAIHPIHGFQCKALKLRVIFWVAVTAKASHFHNKKTEAIKGFALWGTDACNIHARRKAIFISYSKDIATFQKELEEIHQEKMPPLKLPIKPASKSKP